MREEVRVTEVREIPSRYEDAPNGLEIVFQATAPLQPIYLNVKCSDPIQYVEVFPTEDFTGFIKSAAGTVPNAPNIAAVSLSEPAFIPEHAMLVRVYSKTKNRFESFTYQAEHPR
jgi:hypothetical protein